MQIISDAVLNQLADEVGQCLSQKQWRLACAESCTGGWVAKCCTDIAGSSQWFECGFVTYSNASKQGLLKTSTATLKTVGAVSEQTATELAEGALVQSGADISVAITGIAGPSGGSKDKPVGTVWFAWASKNTDTQTEHQQFNGDRENIRRQAVAFALQGIIKNARA
ncbi:MAG: nicotinamide-nucleotide amidase [Gammaproteobacteria bacterium]|nr:nicotinamide-nucleotide amidase [Gammaproteobacteria bacterium]